MVGTRGLRPCASPTLGSYKTIVELCSGMGGMAVGAAFLGGQTVLQVDVNQLACQTASANGRCPQVQLQVARLPSSSPTFLASLSPVNSRGLVLHSVLQTSWHCQAAGVMLECVADVMEFPEVLALIRDFACRGRFQVRDVCLDLADQWVRRPQA